MQMTALSLSGKTIAALVNEAYRTSRIRIRVAHVVQNCAGPVGWYLYDDSTEKLRSFFLGSGPEPSFDDEAAQVAADGLATAFANP